MAKKLIIILAAVAAIAVICVGAFLLWNYPPNYGSDGWNGTTYERVVYSEVSQSDYLNLYVPDDTEDPQLMVLVHGGGFFANDAEADQARYMYEYFRTQGYACASVNYRLSGEASYPAAVNDVKAAVRFLRANAELYGYNADRIVIWGESAGAYLALMAAVTNDSQFREVSFIGEDLTDEPVSGKVDVLVDFYGPVEFWEMDHDFDAAGIPTFIRRFNGTSADGTSSAADSPESVWVGTPVGQLSNEQKAELSPLTYIEENAQWLSDLYVYIRHCKTDITTPGIQSERLAAHFAAALGENHVNFSFFTAYMHASNLYYHEDNLKTLKAFLDEALSDQ